MTNPMDDLRQASADVSGIEVLSPAAYAVVKAAHAVDWVNRRAIAAALRAAADGWRTEVAELTQTDFICGVLRSAESLEEIAENLEDQS